MNLEALIGQTLDEKYLIDRQLGRGGMGAVFHATHVGTQRPVALKVIAPRLMSDPASLERFRREARAAGKLQHPNVVNVTDFGIADVDHTPIAYLAMELLEGFTLGSFIRWQQRLSLAATIDIVEQVAIAVARAHAAGIVHRDLKPENIWLVPDGRGGYQVKVLDFGIATFLTAGAPSELAKTVEKPLPHAREAAEEPITLTQLTRAGAVIGTPAYMSPEQCEGAALDFRSDIYSLGVITYEMLTGQRPFDGGTTELIEKHVNAPPPDPRAMRSEIPARVAEVVQMAMAKRPEQRPVSATAFAGALRARSEGAWLIVRRALAVYSMRAGEFLTLAALAFAPALIIWPVALMIGMFGPGGVLLIVVMQFAACFALIGGYFVTHLLFFTRIDRLRRSPLEVMTWRDVLAELGRSLPEPRTLAPWNLHWRVWPLWRAFFRGFRAGGPTAVSDVMLLSVIANRGDAAAAIAEAKRISNAAVRLMRVVQVITLLAAAPVIPLSLAVVGAPVVFGREMDIVVALPTAFLVACALVPVMAMLSAPLTSTSFCIVYFRARQAVGDDVALHL